VIDEGEVAGWRTVRLANAGIEVAVLPDKGAEIHSIVDVASGVELLFQAPWGLQRPGAPPRAGSGGAAFLENYGGGWQELLPNTNDDCLGLPFHGEVALLPWRWSVVDELTVRFDVSCRIRPIDLTRTMRLDADARRLVLDETVVNRSDDPVQFVWGHHCVLGAPLVGAGSTLEVAAGTIVTIPEMWEDTARLAPGQRTAWPLARGRRGDEVDLSRIPGPDAGSHDDVYLTDLSEGVAELRNPALGLGFRLRWDASVFAWMISWQPYGGAHALPLQGAYGLGVEPWVSGGNLEAAIATGEALTLAGGASLSTTLVAEITDSRPR
jgi:hypothetical protein